VAGVGALTWTIRRWDHTAALGQRRRREDDGFARVGGPVKDRRVAASGPGPGIRGEVPDDSADTPAQETGPAQMNPGQGGPPPAGLPSAGEGPPPAGPVSRPAALVTQIRRLVRAIREGDDALVEAAVVQLSRRRRIFAPLGIAVGAFVMLFEGLKLVLSNWRFTVVEVLPAMWIWAAMIDLKAHAFHGKSFHPLHGGVLVAAIIGVAVITAAGFFLNAVFAFAIADPGRPEIRPAFTRAWSHAATVFGWGGVIGLMLGLAALYVDRWGRWWFPISMSVVIAIMMMTYVSLPSRLIGMKTTYSRADKWKATAVGAAIGGVVCFPPYALGRAGILMLGSHALFIPGIVVLAVGLTLESGATGAVKAIKMSSKLVAGRNDTGALYGRRIGESEAK
jgi:hypothetical protein